MSADKLIAGCFYVDCKYKLKFHFFFFLFSFRLFLFLLGLVVACGLNCYVVVIGVLNISIRLVAVCAAGKNYH